MGACGHEQYLVDYRKIQILTMMGKVAFTRAYYHSRREKEEKEENQKLCGQGRAPADQVWGIDQRRTTPGVQESLSYLCARLTFEEACRALFALAASEHLGQTSARLHGTCRGSIGTTRGERSHSAL